MRRIWLDDDVVDPRAVVLVLHGGAQHNPERVSDRSGSLWRARRLARAITPALHAEHVAVARLRFEVVGWNDPHRPSPVPDARWALDQLREKYADRPIVLLGHSMGARTALAVADDPAVVGIVGVAPWFPADEDVTPIADKRICAAHGSRDKITSARATQKLLARAGAVAEWTHFVPMGPLGHYMLTHQRRWNETAVRECLRVLDAKTVHN